MNSLPLVSVIIPTRNRPDAVEKAVASVLAQTYRQVEVVVVDDGSAVPVRLRIDDPRIRLVRQENSVGVATARNIGFQAANGEFLCLLDDDDWYLPHKIQMQLDYLLSHPEVDLVYSHVRIIYSNGQEGWHLPEDHVHTTDVNFRAFNIIHTNSSLFRRRLLERIRFDERLTKYTDMQFYLDACLHGVVRFLPGEVAVWLNDDRPDQITRRNVRKSYDNFKIICDLFREHISSDRSLRWSYWGRLSYQALRCRDFGGAVKFAYRIIRG